MMEYTELKIRLMQQGAVFTREARANMNHTRFGHIVYEDYATTGGVVVKMDNRIYANVPVKYENTPFLVDFKDQKFRLEMNGRMLNTLVEIMPAPGFALNNALLPDGTPVRELVMVHADRMRISPIHGCYFHCLFCTYNHQRYLEIPCGTLEQAVQTALSDNSVSPRHILISGGTPKQEEGTYQYLNEVYRYFPKKYSDYDFDVMLSPRGLHARDAGKEGYTDFLKYLYEDCGIKTLSVNLELYQDELRRRYIQDKYKIGKDNYYLFIQKAVDIFGQGNVRSSLIAGLEIIEDTLQGVQALCSLGCIPVLSAFVPGDGTDLQQHPKPDSEFLLQLVLAADDIARQHGMELGPVCRPCTHNSITKETGNASWM